MSYYQNALDRIEGEKEWKEQWGEDGNNEWKWENGEEEEDDDDWGMGGINAYYNEEGLLIMNDRRDRKYWGDNEGPEGHKNPENIKRAEESMQAARKARQVCN